KRLNHSPPQITGPPVRRARICPGRKHLPPPWRPAEDQPMRVLILGGTAFLGRAVARAAAAAGHDVTCAARGEAGPLADGVRFIKVDRADPAGLAPLDGERFDAVVDVARDP